MGVSPVLVEGVRTAGTVCVRDSMVLYTVEIKHLREYKKRPKVSNPDSESHDGSKLVNHWASSIFSVAQNQKLKCLSVTLPMKSAAVVASTANRANTEMNKWPEFVPRWPEHANKEHFQSYRKKSVYVTLLFKSLELTFYFIFCCFFNINAAFI